MIQHRARQPAMWRKLLNSRLVGALLLALVAALPIVAAVFGGDDDTGSASVDSSPTAPSGIPVDVGKDDKADLTGAGATFPAPIYQAWFDDYNAKVAGGVKINYQAVGSGGGIQQFTANTVQFGATDAPMSDEELGKAPDAQHLPTVIGAVVMTYNLAALDKPLRLDGPTIARIYLGEITKWNDPAIAALNDGSSFPNETIQVVYRSDSSGTSYVFTDYLSKASPEWEASAGTNKAPNWPTGQGGKGNDGVTGVVKNTPNAIGYVELNYALANTLPFADVKNKAGKFITPSIEASSAAAAGVALPGDYRVSITDADGETSYPITSFTYLLLYRTTGNCAQQAPLVNMLWWVYHAPDASQSAADLDYAPLPTPVLPRIEETLKSLTCDGGSTPSLKGAS
jgi:phosphate transport system substrate-binding protein